MRNRKTYRADHILLEDFEDAEYILEKIEEGIPFSELAEEFSICESATKGGRLPLLYSGEIEPEFEKALSRLKPGEVSGPVETKFGIHIIKKEE